MIYLFLFRLQEKGLSVTDYQRPMWVANKQQRPNTIAISCRTKNWSLRCITATDISDRIFSDGQRRPPVANPSQHKRYVCPRICDLFCHRLLSLIQSNTLDSTGMNNKRIKFFLNISCILTSLYITIYNYRRNNLLEFVI